MSMIKRAKSGQIEETIDKENGDFKWNSEVVIKDVLDVPTTAQSNIDINLDEDDETITMDEMDSDEEEQWLEAHEEETYLPIEKDGEEEDEDTNIEGLNFRSGSVDMEDDDYLDNGEHFDDEDLDEDEGEDEESEEEDDD